MGKAMREPPALTVDGKPFGMGDRAIIGLDLLGAGRRAAVLEAISTPDKVRELVRTAGRSNSATRGAEIRVAEAGGVRLMFRVTPERIELLELIGEEAFRELGIKVRPAEGMGTSTSGSAAAPVGVC